MKKQINPNIKVSTKGQNPNILLIIADDLGQDVVNVTGSGTTRAMQVHTYDDVDKKIDIYGALPNISRILRNGLYFSQAWAQPACSTTRASIYTGLHPWKNGVGHPDGAELDSSKEKGFRTLPTLLPSNYVSGLFGKWHLGKVDPYLPTNHGWVKHVGTLDGVFQGKYNKKDINYTHWLIQDSDDKDYGDTGYLGTETTNYATWREVYEAALWINAQGSATPWFATIAFHSPHEPYHVPSSGYDAATAGRPTSDEDLLPEDAYQDYKFNIMAQSMDWHIGSLLGLHPGSSAFKGIEEARLSNTIIIFIGDNGSDPAVALAEEKGEIYEGSVRVPIIIADGQAVVKEIKGQAITPRYLHANKLGKTDKWQMAHVVDLYKTIVRLVDPAASGFPGDTDSKDFSDVVKSAVFTTRPGALKRKYNFSQLYKTGSTKATIRNAAYKLNYDASKTSEYTLYKYSDDGEIPDLEDPAAPTADAAEDVLTDAISGKNAEAQTNLNLLWNELKANYRCDGDENIFPALPKK
jgi:arylsulfatase A-like enzyme